MCGVCFWHTCLRSSDTVLAQNTGVFPKGADAWRRQIKRFFGGNAPLSLWDFRWSGGRAFTLES